MLFLLLLLLLLMMMMMMMEYANKNWIHTRCFRLVLSKLFETAHLASDANTAYMRQRCRRLNLRESLLKHVSPTWPDSCRPDDWRPSGVAMFWDDFNERRLQVWNGVSIRESKKDNENTNDNYISTKFKKTKYVLSKYRQNYVQCRIVTDCMCKCTRFTNHESPTSQLSDATTNATGYNRYSLDW